MIGNVYKILIERLKKLVNKLVKGQRMTFIKGRQIMDVVLIAK